MVSIVRGEHIYEFRGLSTDVKPTKFESGWKIGNGSTFFEMDTCEVYMFDEQHQVWIKL